MSNDDQPDVDQRFRDIISDFVTAHPQLVTGRVEGLTLPGVDPTLQHVDAGPAGSLKQRIDPTPGHRRTILLITSLVLSAVFAVYLVAVRFNASQMALIVFVALCSGWMILRWRWRTPVWVEQLQQQVHLEQDLARQLGRELDPSRWTVLWDRLIPGTGHRVPALIIGPPGIIVLATSSRGADLPGAVESVRQSGLQILHTIGRSTLDEFEPGQPVQVWTVLVEAGWVKGTAPMPNPAPDVTATNTSMVVGTLTHLGQANLAPHQVAALAKTLDELATPAALAGQN